jgi:hypothetical protein
MRAGELKIRGKVFFFVLSGHIFDFLLVTNRTINKWRLVESHKSCVFDGICVVYNLRPRVTEPYLRCQGQSIIP